MVEIDLSGVNLGRINNQDVNALIIANQLVWEASTADGPYYLNEALLRTPTAYTDGTPNIVTGLATIFAVPGFVTGIRWYDGASGAGSWIFSAWSAETSNGIVPDAGLSTRLASKSSGSTGSGYRDVIFDTPVTIDDDQVYVFSRYNSSGHYTHAPSFGSSYGALTPEDPVYKPGENENISSVVPGWTSIQSTLFGIGGGDVMPVSSGSGSYYGLTPIFFKSL
jgi:hypothetical protein